MPRITAILHTCNDALRIGRALESLRVCDELIVVDHGSQDNTAAVAREYGATVLSGSPATEASACASRAQHDWILCLLPNESLHESLEAALHEWKGSEPGKTPGFQIALREETAQGWKPAGTPLRLVDRRRVVWSETLPPDSCPDAGRLPGEILRFAHP